MGVEAMSGVLPLFIPSENQRNNHGELRECFMLNHEASTEKELEMFFMFGAWLGFCLRTGSPINICLHPVVWKQIVGDEVGDLRDLQTSDKFAHQNLGELKYVAANATTDEEFDSTVVQNFTVNIGPDCMVEVCPGGHQRRVTRSNCDEYLRLAAKTLLTRDSLQMKHLLRGVYQSSSLQLMKCLNWNFAEERACGKQTIDIEYLWLHTSLDRVSFPSLTQKF
jgi:hypothetical protein